MRRNIDTDTDASTIQQVSTIQPNRFSRTENGVEMILDVDVDVGNPL